MVRQARGDSPYSTQGYLAAAAATSSGVGVSRGEDGLSSIWAHSCVRRPLPGGQAINLARPERGAIPIPLTRHSVATRQLGVARSCCVHPKLLKPGSSADSDGAVETLRAHRTGESRRFIISITSCRQVGWNHLDASHRRGGSPSQAGVIGPLRHQAEALGGFQRGPVSVHFHLIRWVKGCQVGGFGSQASPRQAAEMGVTPTCRTADSGTIRSPTKSGAEGAAGLHVLWEGTGLRCGGSNGIRLG